MILFISPQKCLLSSKKCKKDENNFFLDKFGRNTILVILPITHTDWSTSMETKKCTACLEAKPNYEFGYDLRVDENKILSSVRAGTLVSVEHLAGPPEKSFCKECEGIANLLKIYWPEWKYSHILQKIKENAKKDLTRD